MDKKQEESIEDIIELEEQKKLVELKLKQLEDENKIPVTKLKATVPNILQVLEEYEGLTNSGIIKIIMEVFEVSQKTAYTYLDKAYKEIYKKAKDNREQKIAEFLHRYEKLIELNEEREDLKEIRAVLKDYSEILGLKTQKIEVSTELASMFSSMDKL